MKLKQTVNWAVTPRVKWIRSEWLLGWSICLAQLFPNQLCAASEKWPGFTLDETPLHYKAFHRVTRGRLKPNCFILPREPRAKEYPIYCTVWHLSRFLEERALLVSFHIYAYDPETHQISIHPDGHPSGRTFPHLLTYRDGRSAIFFSFNEETGWIWDLQSGNVYFCFEEMDLRRSALSDRYRGTIGPHWVTWTPIQELTKTRSDPGIGLPKLESSALSKLEKNLWNLLNREVKQLIESFKEWSDPSVTTVTKLPPLGTETNDRITRLGETLRQSPGSPK